MVKWIIELIVILASWWVVKTFVVSDLVSERMGNYIGIIVGVIVVILVEGVVKRRRNGQ